MDRTSSDSGELLLRHQHDPDDKALLRFAVVWNIPVACYRASTDFMISSALMSSAYERRPPDYEGHRERLRASRTVLIQFAVKRGKIRDDLIARRVPQSHRFGREFLIILLHVL
jgi:hypothetical protein